MCSECCGKHFFIVLYFFLICNFKKYSLLASQDCSSLLTDFFGISRKSLSFYLRLQCETVGGFFGLTEIVPPSCDVLFLEKSTAPLHLICSSQKKNEKKISAGK